MKARPVTGETARALKSEYLALISDAYDADAVARKEKAWDWLFETPLARKGHATELLALFSEDRLIGATIVVPAEVKIGDEIHVVRGPIGIIASSRHRGAGVPLFRSFFSTYDELYGIAGADSHRKAYRRFGGAVETLLVNHFCPLRPGRILARRKGLGGPLAAILATVDRAWLSLVGLKRVLRAPGRRFETREVDEFGPEFDTLWAAASPGYRLIHRRDAAFLNWRYRDFPLCDYRRFLLTENGIPVGYVVVQMETRAGRKNLLVTDIFCAKDDGASYRALLHQAIGVARRQNADQVILEAPEQTWANGILRKSGFLFRKPMLHLMICSSDPERRALLSESVGSYYFCRGDSDEDY